MSKIKKINLPTSVDKFLDGKIIIEQLLDGGRSNTDTILLSAAVPVGPGYKVLDVGVGNGTSSIALGSNFKDITIIGIDNDPTGISKWINPSLSLWKDVDYGFTGTTWSVNHTWSVNALDKDWSLTPSFDLGLGDDYDYEQLSLKVSTDLNVLGVDIEPSLKLTYLDNDVDVDSLKADSQTSVWAGFTYKF